jgi:hypothetical protein
MSRMQERIIRLTLDGQQVRLRSGNLDRTPTGWRSDCRLVAEVDGVEGQLSGEGLVEVRLQQAHRSPGAGS